MGQGAAKQEDDRLATFTDTLLEGGEPAPPRGEELGRLADTVALLHETFPEEEADPQMAVRIRHQLRRAWADEGPRPAPDPFWVRWRSRLVQMRPARRASLALAVALVLTLFLVVALPRTAGGIAATAAGAGLFPILAGMGLLLLLLWWLARRR